MEPTATPAATPAAPTTPAAAPVVEVTATIGAPAATTPAPVATVSVNITGTEIAEAATAVKNEAVVIGSDIAAGAEATEKKVVVISSGILAKLKAWASEAEQTGSAFVHEVELGTSAIISDAEAAFKYVEGKASTVEAAAKTELTAAEGGVSVKLTASEGATGAAVTAGVADVEAVYDKAATEVTAVVDKAEAFGEEVKADVMQIVDAPAVVEPTVPDVIPPNTVRILFSKTPWSLSSWFVRWALPRSRWSWAKSSHCMIDTGDYIYDTTWSTGVRKVARSIALTGATIVDTVDIAVPDLELAMAFLETQLGKPYDKMGVIGLGIAPDRDWSNPQSWFCYELAAAVLKAAGVDYFTDLNHITETPLLALKRSL